MPGTARNALLRHSEGRRGTFRYQRDRLVEPVHLAPFPTRAAIGKHKLDHVRVSCHARAAAAMGVYGLEKKNDLGNHPKPTD